MIENLKRLFLAGFVRALLALALALPAGTPAADGPEPLRIGFQKSASLLTLLKSRGTLEQRLAPLKVEVKWIEFPAGRNCWKA